VGGLVGGVAMAVVLAYGLIARAALVSGELLRRGGRGWRASVAERTRSAALHVIGLAHTLTWLVGLLCRDPAHAPRDMPGRLIAPLLWTGLLGRCSARSTRR
jgi:hypothetical protein